MYSSSSHCLDPGRALAQAQAQQYVHGFLDGFYSESGSRDAYRWYDESLAGVLEVHPSGAVLLAGVVLLADVVLLAGAVGPGVRGLVHPLHSKQKDAGPVTC
jgi:hypothetical protein